MTQGLKAVASLCCKVLSLPSQASASLQDHNLQVWLDSLPSCPPVPPTPIARLASLCKQSPESAQLRHHTDTDHHHLQCLSTSTGGQPFVLPLSLA